MKVKRPHGTRSGGPRRFGRLTAVTLVAGVGLSLTGGTIATAEPATGDGTTVNLLYSVNGGGWTDSPTAERGDDVVARLFYDTTRDDTLTGVSLTSQIPDGFGYVAGSTRNVLAPGSNVTTGAVGPETKVATVADSVWSGDTITVSPSAGFNGESTDSQQGVLRNGVKRYLNLHECDYMLNNIHSYRYVINRFGTGAYGTGTNTSNNADGSVACGSGNQGWSVYGGSITRLDLLGNRYLNLNECDYMRNGDHRARWVINTGRGGNWGTTTNTSNQADSDPGCGAAGADGNNVWALRSGGNTVLNLVGNRYVNLHECDFSFPADETGDGFRYVVNRRGNGAYSTGTNTSDTRDTVATCGAGGQGWHLRGSVVTPLDTLDPARGQGYIQFRLAADPAPPPPSCNEVVTEPAIVSEREGALTGNGTGNPVSTATISLAEYNAEGEPCAETVLVDDSAQTAANTDATVDIQDNDTIPDDSTGWSVDTTSTEGGTIVDNGDGTVTYTPPAGFLGEDTFTYRVTAPDGTLHEATVTITVLDPAEIPVVAPAVAGLAGVLGLGLAGGVIVHRRRINGAAA